MVILTPSARFDRDAPVELTVAEGLRAAGGIAELKKEASFSHTTHGPLTVTFKNEGGNFYQDFWRNQIEFNNTVDLATARAAIRVTPRGPVARDRVRPHALHRPHLLGGQTRRHV